MSYQVKEVINMAGVCLKTFYDHINKGYIPAPQPQDGYAKRYTEQQAQAIIDHFKKSIGQIKRQAGLKSRQERRRDTGLYTIGEAAKLAGVSHQTLRRRIDMKELDPPQTRPHGRTAYYTKAEVFQLMQKFGQLHPKGYQYPAGLYSLTGAADKLKMPKGTLELWMKTGQVPRPKTPLPDHRRRNVYTDHDLRTIRQAKYDYFAAKLPML